MGKKQSVPVVVPCFCNKRSNLIHICHNGSSPPALTGLLVSPQILPQATSVKYKTSGKLIFCVD